MYSEQFQKSLALVEAARAKNLAMEPERMTAEQKEAVLSAFHPDYREDQFEALKIGPNAGDRVPHELADMLQAHSRITADSVDLTKPDYDTDVLIIGGGGAGTAAAIEAHRAGASVMIVTKLRMGDANTMMAEGGIQAADKPNDSPAIHFVDAFGGDNAPLEILKGAAMAVAQHDVDILLTGDAGTGKSSTVKAVANAMWREGLRIIEVRKDQLRAIPKILDALSTNPLKFLLFIDDLSFLKDDDNFNALKAVLEGSVTAKSSNVVIYATSNRRHIIKEKFSDREGDDVHRNDTMQELISLSERFGIHISFSKPNKETFLHIVHHLAAESGLDIPESELDASAERFALERGGRSARLARQFIDAQLSK